MKIVYSIANHHGAVIQLSRFLTYIKKYKIKIAAFSPAKRYLPYINWTLDSLYVKPFKKESRIILEDEKAPQVNPEKLYYIIEDIGNWEPDLIVSDFEPISLYIAKALNIKSWHCSSLNLLHNIKWKKSELKYKNLLKKYNKNFPCDKKIIYSPFCELFETETNINWIKPYTNYYDGCFLVDNRFSSKQIMKIKRMLPENGVFTSGESCFLSDIFTAKKYPIICPNLKDPEHLLNASICNNFNLGLDIGGLTTVESIKRKILYDYNYSYENIEQSNKKYLHEIMF